MSTRDKSEFGREAAEQDGVIIGYAYAGPFKELKSHGFEPWAESTDSA